MLTVLVQFLFAFKRFPLFTLEALCDWFEAPCPLLEVWSARAIKPLGFPNIPVSSPHSLQLLLSYPPLELNPPCQSAWLPYLSWKIEFRRDWYRSQIGRDWGAKVKICTPVHGIYVWSIAEKPESPFTGVHIFTFAPQSGPFWLLYRSRRNSIFQLK